MFNRDGIDYKPIPLPHRLSYSEAEMRERAEAFLAYMRQRHTVRDYQTRNVPKDIITAAIAAAGTAPSGANHQPWHFVAIAEPGMKKKVRAAAEEEEATFYAGRAGEEWLKALEPIGANASKPHLEEAPWLIVVFAQRYGQFSDGVKYKNYYVPESVGIATGFLIAALHHAGLAMLTHTPNPMGFLNDLCGRPSTEKPIMILTVGYPRDDATVPSVAKIKKPLDEICSVFE